MWAPRNPLAQRAGIVEDPEAPRDLSAPRARQQLRRGQGRGLPRGRAAHGGLLRGEHRAAVRAGAEDSRHLRQTLRGRHRRPIGHRGALRRPRAGRSRAAAAPADARDHVHGHDHPGRAGPRGVHERDPVAARLPPCRARASARHLLDLARTGAACSCATGSRWSDGCCARPPISASSCAPRRPRCGCCRRTAPCVAPCCAAPTARRRSAPGAASCSRPGGFPHDRAAPAAHVSRRRAASGRWRCPAATGDGAAPRRGRGRRRRRQAGRRRRLVPGVAGAVRRRHDRPLPAHHRARQAGIIGVLADGRRFCNEGNGYHDYVDGDAARRAGRRGGRFLAGLHPRLPAPLRPGDRPAGAAAGRALHPRPAISRRGRTIAELARQLRDRSGRPGADDRGVQSACAQRARIPRSAAARRSTIATRAMPRDQPNPCVAPIEQGPFYAVKVVPGSFGTFAGLQDRRACARAGRATEARSPGLYAAGTDMASVMGGHYPAGGINLGPAMTFGYIAGRHAAGTSPTAPAG